MSGYQTTKTHNVIPNFLASEVGLIKKTKTIKKPESATADSNGRIVIAGGTLYKNEDGVSEGIVYESVDVTDGDRAGSVIIAGRVYVECLDAETFTTDVKTALKAQGIYFDNLPNTTRA